MLCEVVWVLETGYGFSRIEITAALERILATAQFEIEGKDLALGALETVTLGRSLKGLEGFRLL